VLLSEASSLTAREHLTVLGTAGVRVEAMSSDPFALCRWSRWARRLHRCPAPGTDPAGYLQAVSAVLAEGGFDALLPAHEQAWLFAVGRDRLPPGRRWRWPPRKASPGCRARSPLPAYSMSSVPEVLTPVIRDPPSLIPLLRVATALLARPAAAAQISGHTIAAYSVTQRAITRLCP